jgi:hypothetical protein
VLKDETDDDMVERLGVEGQVEDIRLPELDIAEPCRVDPSFGLGE